MIFINPVTALKKLKTCSEELPPPGIMQTKNNRQQYNSEMVWLDILWINLNGIWQNYSEDSRIEFVHFSFHVGLLFINFSSSKPDTENNVNLMLYQVNVPNLTRCNFLKHIILAQIICRHLNIVHSSMY